MKYTSFLLATALAAATSLAAAAPATYTVDPTHTSVTAESRHFGTSIVRTHLQAKSGTITLDTEAKTGTATIAIDPASVETGVPKLDEHLKGTDFFDVANYPEATFVGKTFTFDGDKVASLAGDLTLHGQTNPVTLKATNFNCYLSPALKKRVCGGSFEATIQRSLWNVRYAIPFVPDDTVLRIEVEATKD